MTNEIRPAKMVVISIDDVSPCFLLGVKELLKVLPRDIHLVVGLIPNYKGLYHITKNQAILEYFNDFTVEWAMHGYTHTRRGAGGGEIFEFKDLSREEARRRIKGGKDLLRAVGIMPTNFIPPGFEMSRGTIEAVKEEFRITSDLYHIFDLASGSSVKIPCISLNWGRRQLEDRLICYSGMIATYLAKLSGADLRLLTHVQSFSTAKHAGKLIRYILRQGYRSVTHSEMLTAMPP